MCVIVYIYKLNKNKGAKRQVYGSIVAQMLLEEANLILNPVFLTLPPLEAEEKGE